MNLGVVVPPDVLHALRDQYGTLRNIAPTFGGFSNLSFFADTSDGQRVVVKATSNGRKFDDLRNEQHVLAGLADSDLPVPTVLSSRAAPPWQITVFAYIEGTPGLAVVQTRDLVELSTRARALGAVLRTVHRTTSLPLASASSWVHQRLETDSWSLARFDLDERDLQLITDAMLHPAHRRGVALLHGDAGLHNTLWIDSENGVRLRALLDWEWAGFGNPLIDVAWVWWTMRFRRVPTVVFDAFMESYGRSAIAALGWDRETVFAMVRAQMGSILSRTDPGSAGADEWIKRLHALPRLRVP